MKRYILISTLLSLLSSFAFSAMDLTGWTEVDRYDRWTFSNPTATSIRMDETASSQTVAPGWVISNFILDSTSSIAMTVNVVDASGDDDFIGIIFGYRDADHFYLLDWKRGAQDFNWGDTVAINDDLAEQGIKVKKIDGSWTRDGLWGGTDGMGVSTLAGPAGGGWNAGTAYTFTINLTPGHIQISRDGGLLFDIADATFTGGRIGGYGFSQDNLLFSNVSVTPDPHTCVVTLEDFALFARQWLVTQPFLAADFDENGTVDTADLNHLARYWLKPCPAGWPLK